MNTQVARRRWRFSLKWLLLVVLLAAILFAKKRHDDWHKKFVTISALVAEFNRDVVPKSKGVIAPLTVEEVKAAIRQAMVFGHPIVRPVNERGEVVVDDFDEWISSIGSDESLGQPLLRPSRIDAVWQSGPLTEFSSDQRLNGQAVYQALEANNRITPGTVTINLSIKAEFLWDGKQFPADGVVEVRSIASVNRPPWW